MSWQVSHYKEILKWPEFHSAEIWKSSFGRYRKNLLYVRRRLKHIESTYEKKVYIYIKVNSLALNILIKTRLHEHYFLSTFSLLESEPSGEECGKISLISHNLEN